MTIAEIPCFAHPSRGINGPADSRLVSSPLLLELPLELLPSVRELVVITLAAPPRWLVPGLQNKNETLTDLIPSHFHSGSG